MKPAPSITSFLRKLPAVQDDKETDRKRMDIKIAAEFDNSDCSYDKDGVCSTHGKGKKKYHQKRTWTKGKTGLFYWKYTKTHYFVCPRPRAGASLPGQSDRPTFLILKDSAMTRAGDIVDAKKTSPGNMKTKPNKVTAAKEQEVQ